MKFTWGTGIACFYSLFVLVMVSMVVMSAKNPSHLVQENYYEKDLNYESYRKKREKGATIATQVSITHENGLAYLTIELPKTMEGASGEVTLFRPSNKSQDTSFPLMIDDNGIMKYPMQSIAKGLWKVQLDWQVDGIAYFQEKALFI